MRDIYHALVLNMHQPPGNLEHLLDNNDWETKEILFAYDRMPRSLWAYQDIARVHLSLSGTLLETLSNPDFQSRVYGMIDCGKLLWHLQNQNLFEILGTGYYHPVLALIPEADWDEQIARWRSIAGHLLWRTQFNGFWPPEMGFDMRLIPHLKKAGYRYVMVDCEYVDPVGQMSWQELRYRPHIAEYGGEQIIVVVRDRELSDAQLAGMDYGWFYHELHERTKWCDFPPLVTTATDGDNGGWFRNVTEKSNFWTWFYHQAMEEIRAGHSSMRPTFITEYLDRFGAHGQVTVRRGAWNTDEHHGWDFHQWQGSWAQRDTLVRIHDISREFHTIVQAVAQANDPNPELARVMNEAHWRLLRAETSCNLYWGEAWVHKSHSDLDSVAWHLGEARAILGDRLIAVMTPESPAVAEPTPETGKDTETDLLEITSVQEISTPMQEIPIPAEKVEAGPQST
ncbi:MAG: glycoside hydrolase family 57 [Gammaproteobacteria bacterium]|nr:glycoside hydrolase family 57 [Gammaproteobacteria bacterium]